MASPLGRFGLRRAATLTAASSALAIALVTGAVLPSAAPAAPANGPAAEQVPAPAPSSSSTPTPEATATAAPAKPRTPRAATKTRKARNVPERPRDRHHGKRVVYDKALMTVWLMDDDDQVVARYPVVGRWDRPAAGTYRVFSKSRSSANLESKVTFQHMVRFAWGQDGTTAIGLHSIPRYYDGRMMHGKDQLGLPIARGGCVRLSAKAAKHVYRFMDVGDRVVVLPSP